MFKYISSKLGKEWLKRASIACLLIAQWLMKPKKNVVDKNCSIQIAGHLVLKLKKLLLRY